MLLYWTITGTTIIRHDLIDDIWEVPAVSKRKITFRNITYNGISLQQITALIDQSTSCRQFIRLECSHVVIWKFYDNGDVLHNAWWVSRNGKEMVNWGGVDTGIPGCACHLREGKYQGFTSGNIKSMFSGKLNKKCPSHKI